VEILIESEHILIPISIYQGNTTKNNESTSSENNTSTVSLKQGTPPILRRGKSRRIRADSSGCDRTS
jgi:hypothetical protein